MDWQDSASVFQLLVGLEVAFAAFPKLAKPVINKFNLAWHEVWLLKKRLEEEERRADSSSKQQDSQPVGGNASQDTAHSSIRSRGGSKKLSYSEVLGDDLFELDYKFKYAQRRLRWIGASNPYILMGPTLVSFGCLLVSAVDAHAYLSVAVFSILIVVCGLPVILSVLSGVLLACGTVVIRDELNRLALDAFRGLKISSRNFGWPRGVTAVHKRPADASLLGDSIGRWLIKRELLRRLFTDPFIFERDEYDHGEEEFVDDLSGAISIEDERA